MTPSECSRASGVCVGTIYAHLKDETLRGCREKNGRWYIDRGEFLSWTDWAWSTGRFLMHDPTWARGFLDFAQIDIGTETSRKRNNKR